MDKSSDAFQQRLLATFKGEAGEHIQVLFDSLLAIEKVVSAAERQGLIETIFRAVHSLKGAARAVDATEMETLCQGMENVLAQLKRGELSWSASLAELLYETVDLLNAQLVVLGNSSLKDHESAAWSLRRRLAASAETGMEKVAEAEVETEVALEPVVMAAAPTVQVAETVRVAVARLDAILFQAEEMLSAKLTARQRAADTFAAQTEFATLARARVRVAPDLRALQRRLERAERSGKRRTGDVELRRLLDYVAQHDLALKGHGTRLDGLLRTAGHDSRALAGMVDGLLDDVKRALMLPVASAIEMLPRFVRDAARSQGKDIEFVISGANVEIDRRILDELRDPLLHLARNSIDHGIEAPATRVATGKPGRGRIELRISQMDGGRVEIEMADDGAGIAVEKVREAAKKLGVLRADEGVAQDDAMLQDLVFHSGLSTSPILTDFSGRGLGLAIVREKTERLGGSVQLSSEPGAGTCFRLALPLTLSTFRGVQIRVSGQEFIFPTLHLALVTRVARGAIGSVEGRETVHLDGQTVALVRLAQVLGLPTGRAETDAMLPLVVAGSGDGRIAFLVDEVLGEHEVLVKSLGRQLRRVRNIFGATVLGSGQVVPILHVPDLLKSARLAATEGVPPAAPVSTKQASLLVAEDSITSRMLLKGILETAGYRVKTAVDGMDAFTQLRTEVFDLLVSDVDMPRLSGFDLTSRVRAEPTLAELPVVLVTALDTAQDKERGALAGANAYIVKSNFDQSNLLEAIRRLL